MSFIAFIKNISLIKNWPSKSQWKRVFRILTKKEKIALVVFFSFALGSSVFLVSDFYLENTEIGPAVGGRHIEGVIGRPRFINPIYAQINDTDRDLVEIIFSGLMKYGPRGEIIYDLAEDIKVEDNGRIYEVYLKENIFWHDNEKLTADDVIFTIKTIQNPDYKSPLRGNYLGINVEKISDRAIRFKLRKPYSGFLERLTLKIIPEHIWQDIPPTDFPLSAYNLKPIGSGPFQFKNLEQTREGSITSLTLSRFKNYFNKEDKKPYLSEISFQFFENEEELLRAANAGKINGFSIDSLKNQDLLKRNGIQELSLSLPRYFAIFLNPEESEFLSDKNIRQALNYGIDKTLIKKVLRNQGRIVDSPILPEVYGFKHASKIYEFNLEKAESLLIKAGLEKKNGKWVKLFKTEINEFKNNLKPGDRGKEVSYLQTCLAQDAEIYPQGKITGYFGQQTKKAVIKFQEKYAEDILQPWGFKKGTGLVGKTTRLKLNEICFKPRTKTTLKFSLITVEDPVLKEIGAEIKKAWEKLGIEIELQAYPISQLTKDFIKPRKYEMLLFGQVLGAIPDPFPFWHSSQKKDPGLNLSKYENKRVDELLEMARTTLDAEVRAQKYEEFQDILIADAPAIFLYSVDYSYFISEKIKGIDVKMVIDPSKRFSNIENWHVKTRRVWK